MAARLSWLAAPGLLEAFAVQFDPLLQTLAQRQGFAPICPACCCRASGPKR